MTESVATIEQLVEAIQTLQTRVGTLEAINQQRTMTLKWAKYLL